VQVRLRDPLRTEIVLDWSSGKVLNVAPRHDVRLRDIHSAAALDARGVIVTDIVAAVLVVLAVTGIWLRFVRTRERGRTGGGDSRLWRFNWWLHGVGGLTAAAYLVVLGVTGMMLNHKHAWGLTIEPLREIDAEVVARMTPSRVPVIVRTAVQALARRHAAITADDVVFVDYRPLRGYAKVRFDMDDTEVVVDAYEGQILSIARRRDRWIEDLHSGLAFGGAGFLLSDVTSLLLIVLTVNGIYLWVRPAWIGRGRPDVEGTP
jgi:uncharacterized iron-regulated membrane protein